MGFSRGHQGQQGHQGHQPHDDDNNEKDDDEVEDNDKDDNNFKDISALGLDRDLGFSRGCQTKPYQTKLNQGYLSSGSR